MTKRSITTMMAAIALLSVNAQQNYEKGKPGNSSYTYLNDYYPLKEYIDRTKYPNFKLGVGTTVSEYLKKGTVYNLTNSNFTETVAGNAMKMASCVDNNGNMNFSTVTNYVNTATAAGLNVYGHTLAWHSQQPIGWLSKLLQDKEPEVIADGDKTVYQDFASKDFTKSQSVGWTANQSTFGFSFSYDTTNGMKVHTTKRTTNNYDVQYVAMENIAVESGKTYKMIMTIKGSATGSLSAKLGNWDSGPTKTVSFSTDWKDVEVTYTATTSGAFLLLQHGHFVGDIYIKNIRFAKQIKAKTTTENRRCIVVEAEKRVSAVTDNRLFILAGSNFPANSPYEFTADIRANKKATVSTLIHGTQDTAFGNIEFTTSWQTIHLKGTLTKGATAIDFNLSEFADANEYYFDNVSLKINGTEQIKNGDFEQETVSSFKQKINNATTVLCTISDGITYVYVPCATPLTPQEKHDALVGAMDKWIKGMMNACNGKVKAWDLVNEAISGGGNDGEGNYELQHSEGYQSGTWDVGGSAFYWQDFMGDLEYVRQACRLARQYGPSDVKLFINDYNLESTWDSNKKLKSLINWIKKWEADGVTKIDGIGTQMHISYYKDATSQNNQKKAITTMFELLAASGKLVRVSELDMGICDRQFGTAMATSQITSDDDKAMADYYKWIIKEYLRIIPPAQQWGICQWCATDAPGALGTGWRGGEPVGIWDGSYYRKHVYAGFAEGLGGVPTSAEMPVVADKEYNGPVYNLQGIRMKAKSLRELPSGIYIINGKKVKK